MGYSVSLRTSTILSWQPSIKSCRQESPIHQTGCWTLIWVTLSPFICVKMTPEYDEDDDSILIEIKQRFIQLESPDRDPEQVWGFGDRKVHHADQDIFLSDQPHCYLYHELYDHSSLDWRDLLRIGGMWLDIKIDEQTWLPDLGFVQFEQIP